MASRSLSTAISACAALALLLLFCSPLAAEAAVLAAPVPSSPSAGIAAGSLPAPSPAAASADALPAATARAFFDAPAAVDPAAPVADHAAILETAKARYQEQQAEAARRAQAQLTDKVLDYDPALIAAIGNQLEGGHAVCCPAYACAYGDAVLTGQANDHAAYGCGCCTWPGWGGGNSSFRSLGTDTALLREAYDEIAAGRPTVVHVSGPYGEHWICLIGYRDAADPDALTLDNFIALDPANGQEVVASYRYVPYGDACQHVSDLG